MSSYSGPAFVHREEDGIVFEGEDGWTCRIAFDELASDAALAQVIERLRGEPWMHDALCEQFRTEVLWLRQQLPPGK